MSRGQSFSRISPVPVDSKFTLYQQEEPLTQDSTCVMHSSQLRATFHPIWVICVGEVKEKPAFHGISKRMLSEGDFVKQVREGRTG
jgi:hypothetical protein